MIWILALSVPLLLKAAYDAGTHSVKRKNREDYQHTWDMAGSFAALESEDKLIAKLAEEQLFRKFARRMRDEDLLNRCTFCGQERRYQ